VVGGVLLRVGRRCLGRRSARAAWVWLLNPVLLGILLVGAHVDVLAAALGIAAIALAGRRAVLAGALLGAAVGVKITFALLGPAVLFALWRRDRWSAWRAALSGVVGAALVLVPAQLWAGWHLLDQLERARRYVSLASPWRPVVDRLSGPVGHEVVRNWVVVVAPLVLVLVVALTAVVVRRRQAPTDTATNALGAVGAVDTVEDADRVTLDAAVAAVVLGAAYVLAAPYTLPWYDAIAWAPLGLVALPVLDAVLLVRLVAYTTAYVPGRVLGSSVRVQDLTLGYRRDVVPWFGTALLLVLVVAAARPRGRVRPPRRPRSPAGSPR
jgi:hypothetical protein